MEGIWVMVVKHFRAWDVLQAGFVAVSLTLSCYGDKCSFQDEPLGSGMFKVFIHELLGFFVNLTKEKCTERECGHRGIGLDRVD